MGKGLSGRQVRDDKRRWIIEASMRLFPRGRASQRGLAGQVIGEVFRVVNSVGPRSASAGIRGVVGEKGSVGFAGACSNDPAGLPSTRNRTHQAVHVATEH